MALLKQWKGAALWRKMLGKTAYNRKIEQQYQKVAGLDGQRGFFNGKQVIYLLPGRNLLSALNHHSTGGAMNFRSRKLIMPANLNAAGTLFGGQALAWIDEESYIFATCQLGSSRLVTKFMSSIDFRAPASLGDLVEIGAEVVRFGRTSITLKCKIRNKTSKEDILTVDEIVFVMLDENGHPKAHGVTKARQD
jgi:acyl-CoA thioesterase YciA